MFAPGIDVLYLYPECTSYRLISPVACVPANAIHRMSGLKSPAPDQQHATGLGSPKRATGYPIVRRSTSRTNSVRASQISSFIERGTFSTTASASRTAACAYPFLCGSLLALKRYSLVSAMMVCVCATFVCVCATRVCCRATSTWRSTSARLLLFWIHLYVAMLASPTTTRNTNDIAICFQRRVREAWSLEAWMNCSWRGVG
mmetsp:Transcript_63095/g.148609  ORF Transcript_63095/g.148609 Transcript_63095/m.148609 type:complete len:202 (-) Transcript_63095:1924-2529(-)